MCNESTIFAGFDDHFKSHWLSIISHRGLANHCFITSSAGLPCGVYPLPVESVPGCISHSMNPANCGLPHQLWKNAS